MPRAQRRCAASGCDNVVPCANHPKRDYRTERARTGSSSARGYDAEHEARAAALRRDGEQHELPCSLCRKPIDYKLRHPHPRSFVAHHLTRDKKGPLAPAHKVCNERAGQPKR